jgi:hypothetical protein
LSWLKLLSLLVELVLRVMKTMEEQKLVQEGEVKGAKRALELTSARLQKALAVREPAADHVPGRVPDNDPFVRD